MVLEFLLTMLLKRILATASLCTPNTFIFQIPQLFCNSYKTSVQQLQNTLGDDTVKRDLLEEITNIINKKEKGHKSPYKCSNVNHERKNTVVTGQRV